MSSSCLFDLPSGMIISLLSDVTSRTACLCRVVLSHTLPFQEISDELSSSLAELMSQPLPDASAAARQKTYVTYTPPLVDPYGPSFTLLETPSLLASSGTTGFRTWEAALHLGTYLVSEPEGHRIQGRRILELGAGTGFLSILCSKGLQAAFVLATDGSAEVVTDINSNLEVNQMLREQVDSFVLPWGHSMINGKVDQRADGMQYDLVLGADVVGLFPQLCRIPFKQLLPL